MGGNDDISNSHRLWMCIICRCHRLLCLAVLDSVGFQTWDSHGVQWPAEVNRCGRLHAHGYDFVGASDIDTDTDVRSWLPVQLARMCKLRFSDVAKLSMKWTPTSMWGFLHYLTVLSGVCWRLSCIRVKWSSWKPTSDACPTPQVLMAWKLETSCTERISKCARSTFDAVVTKFARCTSHGPVSFTKRITQYLNRNPTAVWRPVWVGTEHGIHDGPSVEGHRCWQWILGRWMLSKCRIYRFRMKPCFHHIRIER